jgi:hypothetical protein
MSYNKVSIAMSAARTRATFSQLGATWEVTASADVIDALARACRRDDVVGALEDELGRRGGAREAFVPDSVIADPDVDVTEEMAP